MLHDILLESLFQNPLIQRVATDCFCKGTTDTNGAASLEPARQAGCAGFVVAQEDVVELPAGADGKEVADQNAAHHLSRKNLLRQSDFGIRPWLLYRICRDSLDIAEMVSWFESGQGSANCPLRLLQMVHIFR